MSIMNAMNIIAGFLSSALAAMGVGGGGLLVIYLTEIVGMEQRAAQGINLVFFLCASVSAMAVHVRSRKIAWRAAMVFALSGALGSFIGVRVAHAVSGELLRKCFGALLIYAGGTTLIKSLKNRIQQFQNGKKEEKRDRRIC